jgi:hypothetical protein
MPKDEIVPSPAAEFAKAAGDPNFLIRIYQDAGGPEFLAGLNPAATRAGKLVERLSLRVVGLVEDPRRALNGVFKRMKPRLEAIPEEEFVAPAPQVAKECCEQMVLTDELNDGVLADCFANILGSALSKETAKNAHPSFTTVLKDLSPDEALILRYIASQARHQFPVVQVRAASPQDAAKIRAGVSASYRTFVEHFTGLAQIARCTNADLEADYIDNLERCGIAQIVWGPTLVTEQSEYERLETHSELAEVLTAIESQASVPVFPRGILTVTNYGRRFLDAVCAAPE